MMMNNEKRKFLKILCLFDLDGTITDPLDSITKGVQHAFAAEGIEVPDRNTLKYFIGPPIRDSMLKFGITDKTQMERIYVKYLEYFNEYGLPENHLYPGIIPALVKLKEAGCVLTIATSKLMLNAIKIAKYHDFEKYFDLIAGCEPDGSRSKKADVIKYVLNYMGSGYEPVMIGDTKYDIIGAKEIGIKSIGCTWGYGSREELEENGADFIADSAEELADILIQRLQIFI